MLATLSFLLASTEAAVAAEHAAAPEGLGEHFGIAPAYVAMQFASFCIVAFVLYRWGFKPVLATMDERTACPSLSTTPPRACSTKSAC